MREGEAELVERLAAKDTAAFDEAYDRHRARVFGFLARLCRQRTLAEDLLQETFLKLATAAPELADEKHLERWLFTVARNKFLSHRRWVLLDLDRLTSLSATPHDDVHTPFDLTAATELEKRMEHALLALPLKYREVMLLVGVEGLSPSDAAVILKLKPDAVRQRLRRARDMLAVKVKDHE